MYFCTSHQNLPTPAAEVLGSGSSQLNHLVGKLFWLTAAVGVNSEKVLLEQPLTATSVNNTPKSYSLGRPFLDFEQSGFHSCLTVSYANKSS